MNQVLIAVALFVVLAGCVLPLQAHAGAFDGDRQGFVIGAGAGFGFTRFSNGSSEDEDAIDTDFRIGYAPSNQLMVYWSSRVAWITEGITLTHGTAGLGMTFYTSPESPSPFVSGTIGFGSLSAPFEDNYEGETAFGLAAGGGYEFAPHWSVAGDLTWTQFEVGSVDLNLLSFMFTVALIGY